MRAGRFSRSDRFSPLAMAIAALLGTAAVAPAQESVRTSGRLLASNCWQCHGATEGSPGFDKVTGKSAAKLYKELKKFQSGDEGENIMARHAKGYTDAQLRELTQWLAMQP